VIERIEDMPEGTMGFRFTGKITPADYEDVLIPGIKEMVDGGEVRCLCELGEEFDGYEAAAMWEDFKTGAHYAIRDHSVWSRLAIVTDIDWIGHMVALFGWLSPGELKLFAASDGDAAKSWVAG